MHFEEECKLEDEAGKREEILTENQIAERETSNRKYAECRIDLSLPDSNYHAPKDALRMLYCAVMLYGSKLQAQDVNCKSFEIEV